MKEHAGVANLQFYACGCLATLAAHDANNQRIIGRTNGVFDTIIGAMKANRDVPGVQEAALGALLRLTNNNAENKDAIGATEGFSYHF